MTGAVPPAALVRTPQASRPGYAPVVLSPWARLAMLAEAVDQLAKDPAGYAANRAARKAWPGWLVQRARVGTGGTAKQPWRRWEASARKLVTDATAAGKRAELIKLLERATTAANSALAPASAQLEGVPSAIIARARQLLEAARSGKTWRKVAGAATGKGAAAAAGGAGGAVAASAGAGAVAAGKRAVEPGGVLDIGAGWSREAKVGAAAVAVGLVAWGIYRATAPKSAPQKVTT